MTATTFDPVASFQVQPTLAVAAGRNLIAAGSIFGAANLFQWGVMSGALSLHPVLLSLSWPVAVAAFIIIVQRLRGAGGEPALRAASWSRWAILFQIVAAVSLAIVSGVTHNWALMMWMSPVGLAFYGAAWAVAALRGGPDRPGQAAWRSAPSAERWESRRWSARRRSTSPMPAVWPARP